MLVSAGTASAATFPTGFDTQQLPLTGLDLPTAIAFAPDGSLFVAEKRGVVKRFSGVQDTSGGQVVIDLRGKVHDDSDRGLLGLALDPAFETTQRLYVLYTSEQALPGTRLLPPPDGSWNDSCPAVPGATDEGCVVAAKLSKVQLDANGQGSETVLVHDWCQQFSSHSIGTVAFGRDGQLYAGAGDGANFTQADYGQSGGGGEAGDPPANPCGDPQPAIGTRPVLPTAEGGALRSQDVRTPNDPTGLDGSIIRVDPQTGLPSAGNPMTGSDVNRGRIIAYGLRNPFRFTPRPQTDELWIGDVGWEWWEEVDRIADVDDAIVENFGWPCFEGGFESDRYGTLDPALALCQGLPASDVTRPWVAYNREDKLAGEACDVAPGASVGPIAFAEGDGYPERYRGGLFFGDYARGCMWFAPLGTDGQPDRAAVEPFASGMGAAVDLKNGPGGDLYYPDAWTNEIVRIRYVEGNAAPVARITMQAPSNVTSAADPPLTVDFDGRTSSDRDDPALEYRWELDGDGGFDDSTAADPPPRTYTSRGEFTIGLRVLDTLGAADTTTQVVRTNNTPPTPEIVTTDSPYAIGETIRLGGSATDAQDGAVPNAALRWNVVQKHCVATGGCHNHPGPGLAAGDPAPSFATTDHPWESFYEVTLTATDADGLVGSTTQEVRPRAAYLALRGTVAGVPVAGLAVELDGEAASTTPFVRTEAAAATLSTDREQTVGDDTYVFSRWSTGQTTSSYGRSVPAGTTTIDAEFDRATRSVAPPTVSGAEREGEALTADDGSWVGHPTPVLTRRWERCNAAGAACAAIPGATGRTYTASTQDTGARLRAVVTGANEVKAAISVASAVTGPIVAADAPDVTLTVERGDPYAVGDVIAFTARATDSTEAALPADRLRWEVVARRCAPECIDTPVAAQTGATGEITVADRAWRSIHVVTAVATDTAGRSTTVTKSVEPRSATITPDVRAENARVGAVAVLVDGEPAEPGRPVTRGLGARTTLGVPERLDAGAAQLVFRRWSDGETDRTRTVALAADGLELTAFYDTASRSISAPSLDGRPAEGELIRLAPGRWAGDPAPALTVGWERCRSGACVPIPGALGDAYLLGPEDVGSSIRARVTAVNGVLEAVDAVTAGTPQVAARPRATPVGPVPARDRTPPTLRADVTPTVRAASRVGVVLSCPAEACTARVAPRILSGRSSPARLASSTHVLRRGVRKRVTATIGPRALKRVRAALAAGRGVRVEFVVTARDSVGNAATRRWSIRLR